MNEKKKFTLAIVIIASVAALGCIAATFFIIISAGFLRYETQKHASLFYQVKNMGNNVVASVTPPAIASQNMTLYEAHIYCPNDAFESRSLKKDVEKEIKSYFPEIDKNLSDDVYLYLISCGDNSDFLDYDYNIGFRQMLNGAIVDDTVIYATIKDDQVTIVKDYSKPFLNSIPDLDTASLVPINEIKDIVEEQAKNHEDEMFFGSKEAIKADYTLHYGTAYGMASTDYYYEFIINEYSHIIINPFSGDIIFENYWNGVYID